MASGPASHPIATVGHGAVLRSPHVLDASKNVRPLTTDMTDGSRRPYFLWDEDVSIDELREALRGSDPWQRDRLMGKMLREARDVDVWHFTTPSEVATALPRIRRRLGRREAFWSWLIEGWRQDGLLE